MDLSISKVDKFLSSTYFNLVVNVNTELNQYPFTITQLNSEMIMKMRICVATKDSDLDE